MVLAPHTVRLRPRDSGGQMTHMFSLRTDPPEAGRSVNSDLDGNTTVTLWFTGETDSLAIDTSCVVETLRENPFDFIVSDVRFLDLPMEYPREQKAALRPYLAVSKKTALAVSPLREEILSQTMGKTTDFILSLCEHIHDNFPHTAREQGGPWSAERTLREKKGVLQGPRGTFRGRMPLGGSCVQTRKRLCTQRKKKKRRRSSRLGRGLHTGRRMERI